MKQILYLLILVIPLSAQHLTITMNNGTAQQGQLIGITADQIIIQRSSGQIDIIDKKDVVTIVDNTARGAVATVRYKEMTSLVSIPVTQSQDTTTQVPESDQVSTPSSQPVPVYLVEQANIDRSLEEIAKHTRMIATVAATELGLTVLMIIGMFTLLEF